MVVLLLNVIIQLLICQLTFIQDTTLSVFLILLKVLDNGVV